MKDAGGEDGVGFPVGKGVVQVRQGAGAAAGDDGNGDGAGDGGSQGEVVPGQLPVLVHTGQQDFAGAQGHGAEGPFYGVQPGGVAPAVGVHLPAGTGVYGQRGVLGSRKGFAGDDAAGVNGGDDALAAELGGAVGHQLGGIDGGGVDGYLVGAGVEHTAHVGDGADAAAHGEGDENLLGDGAHHGHHSVAGVAAGGDVQEYQLVGAFLVIAGGQFGGVAGVAEVDEAGAFDHAAGVNIEAGDDAAGKHDSGEIRRAKSVAAKSPFIIALAGGFGAGGDAAQFSECRRLTTAGAGGNCPARGTAKGTPPVSATVCPQRYARRVGHGVRRAPEFAGSAAAGLPPTFGRQGIDTGRR